MRNLQQEAAIWYFFTSPGFFEGAARECDDTAEWFARLAVSGQVANFGRNNRIYDTFKGLARDLMRGAELARYGDYQVVRNACGSISGDFKGMMDQPLHSWMSEAEYQELTRVRISRILAYTDRISHALANAYGGAAKFFDDEADLAGRRNDDDGFPDTEIVETYTYITQEYPYALGWKLPSPAPAYIVDTSVACATGEEVPWTGVWYPSTGLERHSLTFAIKGLQMQPVYQVLISKAEAEPDEIMGPRIETVAKATTWHPVISSASAPTTSSELRAKAGEPCPKAGVWQPMEPGAEQRTFRAGETMPNLGTVYGITVWRWIADR